jgi:hypothetical protein
MQCMSVCMICDSCNMSVRSMLVLYCFACTHQSGTFMKYTCCCVMLIPRCGANADAQYSCIIMFRMACPASTWQACEGTWRSSSTCMSVAARSCSWWCVRYEHWQADKDRYILLCIETFCVVSQTFLKQRSPCCHSEHMQVWWYTCSCWNAHVILQNEMKYLYSLEVGVLFFNATRPGKFSYLRECYVCIFM